ncbi:MAG: glycosyltransferase family 4 protein [Stenotrophobium sp.]
MSAAQTQIMATEPKPLRVLHVSEVVLGGIATYLDALLLWQGRHYGRQAVALLLPEEHVRHLSAATREAVTLLTYRRTGRNLSSFRRLLWTLRRQVLSLQPQIVHAHSSFAGFLSRMPGAVGAVPVVYTPNGWGFDREDPPLMRKLYAVAERSIAGRAAAIVTSSEYETRVAVAAGIARERIHIIAHGIDTDRLCSETAIAEPRTGPLQLLFIGRLDPQKGFDWLLQTLEPLGPAALQLTVAGSRMLTDQDQSLKRDNIRYVGWVTQDALDGYIDACDAVIMPSRWEGFPFVVLETMRRGRPLLVSDRGALPEMVGDGEAGLVFSLEDPGQARQLLKTVSRARLEQMGRKARAWFVENFTSEKMNQSTHRLYCSLANAQASA